jgi:predicted RNase H-like nuclease (RuvC/YqgF family)
MKSQQLKSFNFRNLALSLIGFICSLAPIWAQPSSTVSSHNEVVDKVQRTGLKVSIAFGDRKVKDAWESYLKKTGKVSSSKSTFEVETAKIPSISPQPIRLMSKVVEESNNSAYVFCAFDLGTGYITSADSRYTSAEKFLKDFAVKMYRDEYAEQIAAAEKVLGNAQKNQEKLVEKDADWNKEIQNSQQDIVELEKKIQDKKAKIVELNQQIETNKTTKLRAAEETERARKVVEQMKLKLGTIN